MTATGDKPGAATNELALTWVRVPCEIFGWRYDLTGLPEGSFGSAYKSKKGTAQLWSGPKTRRYVTATGKTVAAAIKRLNKAIDRRSIGLFGVDTVTFRKVAGK
jgi:hypothetical protein